MKLLPLILLAGCSDSLAGPIYGTPARMLLFDGATQTGVVGQPVPVPPVVLVIDSDNKPVPGVAVSFSVHPGGGSVAASSATTDLKGQASPGAWTLGGMFGTRTLTASVPNLASVVFAATAIAPDAGMLAFTLADPAGDTLGASAPGLPKGHDVLSVRGDFKRDSLIVSFNFAGPVGPVSAGGQAAVGGFVELDMDNDVTTGIRAASNSFGAAVSIGVDFQINLFNATSTIASVQSFSLPSGAAVMVPVTFSGSTLSIRIPLAVLGNDDGRFAVVGLFGTIDRPTDFFPNSGAVLAQPGGGT